MTASTAPDQTRLVIVGPGAVGSLLACRLATAATEGHSRVTLLDHDAERAARLAATGIVHEENGRQRRLAVTVTTAARIQGADIVLVCVKSWQLQQTLASINALLADNPLVVFFQNGIGHLEQARQLAASVPAALAVTAFGATLLAPGHVRFGGNGLTRMGAVFPAQAQDARLAVLADLFAAADLRTEPADDMTPWLWDKLMVNAAINPLSALNDCPNGALLQDLVLRRQMEDVVREGAAVAAACGVRLPAEPLARTLSVCRDTAANLSSMLQDVRGRRRTEIMAITGSVVQLAQQNGLAVPVNESLLHRVRSLEAAYLSP